MQARVSKSTEIYQRKSPLIGKCEHLFIRVNSRESLLLRNKNPRHYGK
jgi:hypothetical protein